MEKLEKFRYKLLLVLLIQAGALIIDLPAFRPLGLFLLLEEILPTALQFFVLFFFKEGKLWRIVAGGAAAAILYHLTVKELFGCFPFVLSLFQTENLTASALFGGVYELAMLFLLLLLGRAIAGKRKSRSFVPTKRVITADACTLVFAALYLICTAILAMCREQAWTEAKAGADAGMGMLDYLNLLTIPAYSPLERVLDWLCAFVRPLYLLCVEWRWSQKARRGFSSTKLMKNTPQENH